MYPLVHNGNIALFSPTGWSITSIFSPRSALSFLLFLSLSCSEVCIWCGSLSLLQMEVVSTFKRSGSFQGAVRRRSSVLSQLHDVTNISTPTHVVLSTANASAAPGSEFPAFPTCVRHNTYTQKHSQNTKTLTDTHTHTHMLQAFLLTHSSTCNTPPCVPWYFCSVFETFSVVVSLWLSGSLQDGLSGFDWSLYGPLFVSPPRVPPLLLSISVLSCCVGPFLLLLGSSLLSEGVGFIFKSLFLDKPFSVFSLSKTKAITYNRMRTKHSDNVRLVHCWKYIFFDLNLIYFF